ncbi:MAG TPA: PVC-type heme-binding CxxCH protein, partial [Opitutus sp.]|nr:PVC-type heme-binding CxxCH protein [Opitutus sp.]
MIRSLLLLLVIGSISVFADPPTRQPIFDGQSLAGWEGDPQLWRVEDGAITAEIAAGSSLKNNAFLYWSGEVHDFDLSLEFRISGAPSANSGIQYRSQRLADGHAAGYQADLDDGAVWLGRIYDEHGRALLVERGTRVSIAPDGRRWVDEFAKPESFRAIAKPGDWNTYRITAKASHVELWINDVLFATLDDHQSDAAEFSGRLAFQLHSGDGPAKVQFRNIQLAHLGRTALLPAPKSAPVLPKTVQSISPTDANGQSLNLGLERASLAGWQAEGDAWVDQPLRYAEPSTPRRKTDAPTDPIGNYWIGPSSKTGDYGVGRLTSPTFEVTHRWASYLVGGGADINQTRIELVDAASGAIIHSASGKNSPLLRREIVDFASALGRKIFIRLVDNTAEGPSGYIAFDDFVFHDDQPNFAANYSDQLRQHTSPVLWHLQPNPAAPSRVPNVDAQKVVRDMMLVDGFQAELIAAEPDVHQPIAMAIDEKGRLWIAEAYSYPNKQPVGEGKDRLIILEDQDGDGTFETRKVFIEHLNLVSGFELGFGGVWVGAAPELLFIPDRNRDDRPDGPPEVLLDGWGYQDTHETLNSFTWGPDGWLYGVQGVFTESLIGKPGTPDGQRSSLRAGVWRYHPIRHEFEIFANGGSNQWGVDFNEAGHLFMTHCRSFHGGGGTTHIIRNAHYWNQANADYAPFISNS